MASSKVNSTEEMGVTYGSANSIRIGKVVLLRDAFPCKVVDYAKSKTGKHGSAKLHVVGLDLISGKKYDDIFQSTKMVCFPVVDKIDYGLVDILDDRYLQLQHPDGTCREDLRADGDLLIAIKTAFSEGNEVLITVLRIMDQEKIITFSSVK